MKKSFLIGLALLLAVACMSNFIYAQRYYRNAFVDKFPYELDLTEEQIKEINRLDLQFEKEITSYLAEIRNLYLKLDELEMQRNPNQEEIDKLIERIYEIEDKAVDKEVQYQNKIRELLTERQRILLNSLPRYRDYMRPRLGRFGCEWGLYGFRGRFRRNSTWGNRGYYGYGRNTGLMKRNRYLRPMNSRYYQRFGYQRGLGRGRLGNLYNLRFYRRGSIW